MAAKKKIQATDERQVNLEASLIFDEPLVLVGVGRTSKGRVLVEIELDRTGEVSGIKTSEANLRSIINEKAKIILVRELRK